jgi:hypothetical protein
MTNGPVSTTSTNDALTKGDYEKIREAHEAKVRAELAKESEKDRQKRLWAEQNAARNDNLGS